VRTHALTRSKDNVWDQSDWAEEIQRSGPICADLPIAGENTLEDVLLHRLEELLPIHQVGNTPV
jgi:hypothetical protein